MVRFTRRVIGKILLLYKGGSHFNLKDQVCFEGRGNVIDSTRKGMQTEAVTEKGMIVEIVAEKGRSATEKGITAKKTTTGRIRRKPSWMKKYQM